MQGQTIPGRTSAEPIALIGLACRVPGADSAEEFWQLLADGGDAISEVPAARWEVDGFYDPDAQAPGKAITRRGGFLRQVDHFDAFFFGISPREAIQMDPQQRLILELAWEALADAGQDVDGLRESNTGVFFGASWADYATLQHKMALDYIAQHTATGTHFSIIANRVSYVFGFRGPSMVIDTACSSSLVAVHQACQALRYGECTLALAGGVHLMLAPDSTIMMSKFGGLSPDGLCRAFDARANGFVRSEGAGVVVLKPLSQAMADGDPIYCLIRGSAVNNDGRETGLSAMQRIIKAVRGIRNQNSHRGSAAPTGLTVPSAAAQEAVLRAAYSQAGVLPEKVHYVEAHGTGTALGDPIEARALGAVLGAKRPPERPLVVGSVKTNIGHLEAAAGIAGLIKVVLAIKHRTIPPSLHFEQPNPNIPFDTLKLTVPTALRPWPDEGETALAGVSSFGFGGTNCHVVLQALAETEAEKVRRQTAEPVARKQQPEQVSRPYLLPLSARSAEARQEVVKSMLAFVRANPEFSLNDLCYSAAVRRTHHDYRLAVAVSDRQALLEKLAACVEGETPVGLATGQVSTTHLLPPVFVFSGQGSQWWAMGRELLWQEPAYRRVIEECDLLLRPYTGWSLLDELLADEANSRLAQTAVAQPAIFALQMGLAALWQSWGIVPGAVVGHSVGEIAAACVAGSLTLAEAVKLVYRRSQLMQAATGLGKMAAVSLAAAEAEALLNGYADRLAIAAMNGPHAVVLSGDAGALEDILGKLEKKGIEYRRLPMDYAFHSPQMAPFQHALVDELAGLAPAAATIPFFSTVYGQEVNGQELDASYWGRNVREPVRFDEAIGHLVERGFNLFLEIGPHPVLTGNIRQRLEANQREGTALPSLRRGQPAANTMVASLGTLYTQGYPIPWARFYSAGGRVLRQPAYPWQRQRYWINTSGHRPPASGRPAGKPVASENPLLGRRLRSPLLEKEVVFESPFNLATLPFLDDHRLYRSVVVPAACHISMLLSAARVAFGANQCRLTDLTFPQALALEEEGRRLVHLVLTPEEAGRFIFKIYSTAADEENGPWAVHVSGALTIAEPVARPGRQEADWLQAIQARCQEEVSGQEFYQDFTTAGYHLGPRFQWIEQIWRRDGEALCQMRLPAPADAVERFQLHPGLTDSILQLLCTALPGGMASIIDTGDIYIPLGIDAFHFYRRPEGAIRCHARLRSGSRGSGQEHFVGDIQLVDTSGHLLADVEGVHFKRAPRHVLLRNGRKPLAEWLYQVEWRVNANQSPALPPEQPSGNGHWIIFADTGGLGDELAALLAARGQHTVKITAGDSASVAVNGRRQLNPAQPQDFARLVKESVNSNVGNIVFLWGLDTPAAAGLESIEASQALACRSLLYLVRALATASDPATPRLWIATRGAQRVSKGDKHIAIAQAPLWGLGRVIALEHPELWGGLLDLDPAAEAASHADLLLETILASAHEDQVAWRDGQRYLARLARHRYDPSPGKSLTVRPDGTYLITGGLGGLGLLVARWLATQGAKHLVLVGRSQPTAAKQEALRQLEQMDTTIALIQADVSRAEQVASVLTQIDATMPPLRGIVHAAGVLNDAILLNQEWDRFTQVMAPKVAGAWHLHQQTLDQPLDFFILFSSIAGLIGAAGQANYAAANAFLDALAHERQLQGRPALSINWGPWAGVGMAAALSERKKQHWLGQGIGMIEPEQGVAFLAQAPNGTTAQVAVLPVHWATFARQASMRREWSFFAEFFQTVPEKADPDAAREPAFWRQLAQKPQAEQKNALLAHIQQQARQVLGIDSSYPLNPRQRLFEVGMDSLMAVELSVRLQTSLEKSLSKTVVFDYPTVQALTNYLAEEVLNLEEVTATAAATANDVVQAGLRQEIEALSEQEAETLLLQELAEGG